MFHVKHFSSFSSLFAIFIAWNHYFYRQIVSLSQIKLYMTWCWNQNTFWYCDIRNSWYQDYESTQYGVIQFITLCVLVKFQKIFLLLLLVLAGQRIRKTRFSRRSVAVSAAIFHKCKVRISRRFLCHRRGVFHYNKKECFTWNIPFDIYIHISNVSRETFCISSFL